MKEQRLVRGLYVSLLHLANMMKKQKHCLEKSVNNLRILEQS